MTQELYSAEVIEGFRAITTASISDALQSLGVHGYLPSEIQRYTGTKIVGPAVTIKEVPAEEAVPPQHALEAIDASAAGSVIVIDINGERNVAAWGGLMTAGAVANELAGAVIYGGVRDVEEISRDFDFTVFAVASSPATTVGRFKTIFSNEPITLGAVTVNPGDLIVGDRDGLVSIPQEHVAETLTRAIEIENREKEQTKLILESRSLAAGLAKYNRI